MLWLFLAVKRERSMCGFTWAFFILLPLHHVTAELPKLRVLFPEAKIIRSPEMPVVLRGVSLGSFLCNKHLNKISALLSSFYSNYLGRRSCKFFPDFNSARKIVGFYSL